MRDVIVIGAGGGGAVVAKELAGRGLDVLVLEAGPRFARPREEWTKFDNDANNPSTGFLRWGPADRDKPPWQRDVAQSTAILQVAGVGGTTLHFFGNSVRSMPGAFAGYEGADRSAYDGAHLFPLSYRELVPYYEWVEHILPVETTAMGRKEQVFFNACERAGLPLNTTKDVLRDSYRSSENAILQPGGTAGRTEDPSRLRFPEARGCTFCGHCYQGCTQPIAAPRNLVAKRSTDSSYMPMALTADAWASGGRPVTLVTDAFATKIATTDGPAGPAAGAVTWRIGATGESHTEPARVVVMAAGAIESPRLWLSSGLPNPNDWVGRGLTDHYTDIVTGLLPEDGGGGRGPTAGARADFPGRGAMLNGTLPPAGFAEFVATGDSGMHGFYDNGSPEQLEGTDMIGRLVGTELKDYIADIGRIFVLVCLTDDDVQPNNRVSLSTTLPPDDHGQVPRVQVDYRHRTARTLENRRWLVRRAAGIARAAGATSLLRVNPPPLLVHIHSTMRMGAGESDSVLDGDGAARAVDGLYVADNSALANAVGGENPTLTTQALATRTAERIFQRHFGGDPWVQQESPVSSIDDVVTRAVVERGL